MTTSASTYCYQSETSLASLINSKTDIMLSDNRPKIPFYQQRKNLREYTSTSTFFLATLNVDQELFSSFFQSVIVKQNLVDLFATKDRSLLNEFLDAHKILSSQLLEKMHSVLITEFPKAKFQLEVVKDEEIEKWETLYVNILSEESQSSSFDKLERVLKNWYVKQPIDIRKILTLSLQ